ncbi:carbohydrate kinase family protein [Erwiniaceae bacterium BAC15a-03b]|uniref:Carbohydrate kinase family protein n=1 Tax=Winslowiella arboricola TaxID=2978220 RepID=A0A9J6PMG8_9GAMM|nr:carbohydrate kinase family protein [Winslowiella arboricola]MCU5771478.1 carbohydrate kinase family protein [Winslowiella arboricola]MCU5778594.1 carbohydrate kinase family protein [Winslowiella arboricola]
MDRAINATLYVVGNINVDLIMSTLHHWPAPGTETMLEHSELRPGGSAGNCALALDAMHVPHRAVASQGCDGFASWLAGYFTDSAAHWPRYQCETSLTVAVTHPDKERSFISNQGHIVRLTAEDVLQQLPLRAQPGDTVLLCGTFLCTTLFAAYPQLLATLQQRGFVVAVDTGWPPQGWSDELRQQLQIWLTDCDYLLLNEVETLGFAGLPTLEASARALAAQLSGNGACVVKCGSDGAQLWQPDHHLQAAARAVGVIDTIGAGDSFNAGFLSALLCGEPHQLALQWGIEVAAHAISSSPRHYPDWQTLQQRIKEC